MHVLTCQIRWEDARLTKGDEWVSPWEVEIDNLPLEAERTSESVTAAPQRFNLNTRIAGIGEVVTDDDEPGTNNVPSSGIISVHIEATNAADDGTAAQTENKNQGPISRGNNAHHTGSIKLFGKILSYNVSA